MPFRRIYQSGEWEHTVSSQILFRALFRCLQLTLLTIQTSSWTTSFTPERKMDHSSWNFGNTSMFVLSDVLISIASYSGHFHQNLGQDWLEQDSVRSSSRTKGPKVFKQSIDCFYPIFSGRWTVQKQQLGTRSARWPTCTYILTAMELPSLQSHSASAGRSGGPFSFFAHILLFSTSDKKTY